MNNALFISSIATHFKALLPLAETIKSSENYNPVFYFDTSSWPLSNEVEVCTAKKIDFIIDIATHSDSPGLYATRKKDTPKKLSGKSLPGWVVDGFKDIYRFFKYISAFYKNIKSAEHILRKHNISCIILAEDANYISPFFVKAAQRLNIKTIVSPFSFSNQEESVFACKNKKECQLNYFSQRVFVFFFQKWKLVTNGRPLIRKRVSEALAMEMLGCAPKDPWIYIGGNASEIIVDSAFAKDYYVLSCIRENKIRIAGNKDQKPQNTKGVENTVSNKFDITSKKNVLCSLPPDLKDEQLFSSHREMTEFWIKNLKQPGVRLVVSLHPRLSRSDFSFIENDYNVEISNTPINELIEECDIFVACISATIRTALAYKKLVINFDMFNFNYSEYHKIPMVINVKTKEDFVVYYKILLLDSTYIEGLKKMYNNYPESYFGSSNKKYSEELFATILN